jgi:hypothetical protein
MWTSQRVQQLPLLTSGSKNKDILFPVRKSYLWFSSMMTMLSYSPNPGPQISISLQRKLWDLENRNLVIVQAIGHREH